VIFDWLLSKRSSSPPVQWERNPTLVSTGVSPRVGLVPPRRPQDTSIRPKDHPILSFDPPCPGTKMLLLSFSDERVNAIGRATDLFRGTHATVLKDPTTVQLAIRVLATFNRIILSFRVEPTESEGPGLYWQFMSPRRGNRRRGMIRSDTCISVRNVQGFQQFHIRLEECRTD
jgi:hypothetical protein